ncbi:hypothetical protein ATN38_08065 [Rhodococcus sp. FH8]|jgi:hypothetical protein|uniref:restriction endonuclease n=1 Tax=Rhodococcus sp. FH8 TaxID=1761013 RepID=UPI001C4EC532|nr:restriction endonuclease [Rhodococcus sp. FH8]MBW0286007.1 hypothetical protein [Rhodococcus sp. FH8]
MAFIASAREAEINAAARMREFGFGDAQATPIGADGGVDVRSSRAIAEVKWKSAQAGRPEVQKLYGARGTKHHLQLFFFAAGGFSKGAVQYADETDVKLFTYDPNGVVTPANRIATAFVHRLRSEEAERRRLADQKRADAERERVKAAQEKREAEQQRRTEEEERKRRSASPPHAHATPPPPTDVFAAQRAQIESELAAQEKREAKRRETEAAQAQRRIHEYNKRMVELHRQNEIRSRGKIPTSAVTVVFLWFLVVVLSFVLFIFAGGAATGWFQGGPYGEAAMVTVVLLVMASPFAFLLRGILRSLKRREIL